MIRSTFYGFNIGLSGLMTAQKALDLTGNNFTNMNTVGYTRQRLDLNSIPSSNFHDRYAPANNVAIGGGVNVTKVAQLRDPFLDRRFRNEAAAIGQMDAHLSVMSEISRIFDEVQFEQGLYKTLSDMMTQLQRYSTQTGEVTLDATVATAANAVLTMFQMYAVQIQNVRDYQVNLLNGHGGSVPEVNKMLENIALLNKNIRECEIYGNPALELKDQRNLLLDQLSAYMKIEVSYELDKDPVLAKMGIEVCRVEFISDNIPPGAPNSQDLRTLVNGVQFTNLHVATNADGKMYIYKQTPLINNITKRPNDNMIDPAPGFEIGFETGALRGALEMLNSEGAFDTPPNTLNGIGYYEKALDRIVADFAETLNKANEALNPVWVSYWNTYFMDHWDGTGDRDPSRADLIIDATAAMGAAPPVDQFEARPLFESIDGGPITARNIKIAEGWKNGSYTLTTSKVLLPGNTAGDTSNLEYMISLFEKSFDFTTKGIASTDPTAHPLFSGSFVQMFKLIGLNAANDAAAKEKALAANTNVIIGIEDLRNALSSVSMDEEGINLLRFQKSYAAAARVITTLDEALEVLINRTGIVGR